MEKGPNAKPENNSSGDDDNEEDDDEDHELYEDIKNGSGGNMRSIHKLYRNGVGNSGGSSSGSGFRIRIPTGVSIAQPGTKFYGKMDHQRYNSSPNVGYGASDGFGARVNVARPVMAKREKEKDPIAEMVSAIKVLGDGFVRMEQMKMDMAREIETMRMEMEMKRTEMILESQQRIVEAFAQAVAEKKTKKLKRFPSPDA